MAVRVQVCGRLAWLVLICKSCCDSTEEGDGIKLAAHNVIRTITQDGNSPIADKGNALGCVRDLDLGTKLFGIADVMLGVDVDQYQIVAVLMGLHERIFVSLR